MAFSKKFDTIMTSKKVSNVLLSKLLDEKYDFKISKESIGKYRNGTRTPSPQFIELTSKILNINPKELFEEKTTLKRVPIIGKASCGTPVDYFYQDNGFDDYIDLPTNRLNLGEHIYAVVAEGDSMLPEIKENDVVVCDQDAEVKNGDLVHYTTVDGESGIKKYRRDEDNIVLTPLNDNFAPIVISAEKGDIEPRVARVAYVVKSY